MILAWHFCCWRSVALVILAGVFLCAGVVVGLVILLSCVVVFVGCCFCWLFGTLMCFIAVAILLIVWLRRRFVALAVFCAGSFDLVFLLRMACCFGGFLLRQRF